MIDLTEKLAALDEHTPGFDAAADDQHARDVQAAKTPPEAVAGALAYVDAALDAGGLVNDAYTRAERHFLSALRGDSRMQFILAAAFAPYLDLVAELEKVDSRDLPAALEKIALYRKTHGLPVPVVAEGE